MLSPFNRNNYLLKPSVSGLKQNRTDVSNAKIVSPVGTGGNPGYAKVAANSTQPSGQLSNNNIPL
jgi:hypothetical protein